MGWFIYFFIENDFKTEDIQKKEMFENVFEINIYNYDTKQNLTF